MKVKMKMNMRETDKCVKMKTIVHAGKVSINDSQVHASE